MSESLHELSIERFIAAPPSVVWHVMTERLEEWWCPAPWRAEIDAAEWRAGGRFDTTMHGPEGEKVPGKGIFLEVTPNKRLVFTDALDGEWNPQDAFMVGLMELTPEGDGTRYRASARHWHEDAMHRHAEMGFVSGWGAAADQLAALAEGAAMEG